MRAIFSDLLVENVESDPTAPGVFMTARRARSWSRTTWPATSSTPWSGSGRCRDLNRVEELWFVNRWRLRRLAGKWLPPRVKALLKRSNAGPVDTT